MALTNGDLQKIGKLIDTKVDKKLAKQRKEITSDVASFIQTSIIPQFEEIHEKLEGLEGVSATLDRIERSMVRMEDRLDNHGQRIDKLEDIHPAGKHTLAT